MFSDTIDSRRLFAQVLTNLKARMAAQLAYVSPRNLHKRLRIDPVLDCAEQRNQQSDSLFLLQQATPTAPIPLVALRENEVRDRHTTLLVLGLGLAKLVTDVSQCCIQYIKVPS